MPLTPGGWLRDTLALYGRVFRRGGELAAKNLTVGLIVVWYETILRVVMVLASPLGFLAGIPISLALAACGSSWLALVEQVIRTGRVRFEDVPASFTAYLNDLLSVLFLLWILSLVAGIVLPPGSPLAIVFGLAVFVFFNAVPELIYLGRHSATDLLAESYRFIGENWIEWFPANLALLGLWGAVLSIVPAGPFGLVSVAVAGVVLYFASIVRGLLYLELASSTRRSREFRRRAAGS
jgi:hypothetical protein